MTSNVPRNLPIVCGKDRKQQILNWISKQPKDPLDECANRLTRWSYTVTDLGLDDRIIVKDNSTGDTFESPINTDLW